MRPALAVLAALVAAPVLAQTPPGQAMRGERSTRDAQLRTVLDGNRVGLTLFNYGLAAGVGELRGNWPLGSDDFYLGDFSLVVGAEVVLDDGTRTPVVAVPRGPGNRGIPVDPTDPTVAWTFEAVPGYAARGGGDPYDDIPARSDRPDTWPTAWPDRAAEGGWAGSWDGLLGRDRFVDGVEVYAHLADDNVRGVPYTPDPADPSRGGAGLVVRQRAVALRDAGFQDAVVYVWDVVNASPRDLDAVALGFVAGTLSGGDGDSQDDVWGYDAARRLVYSYDFNNSGNQGQPVGYTGFVILPTEPGGPALFSALGFAPSNTFPLSDRLRVWSTMRSGTIDLPDVAPQGGVDGDLFLASDVFGLAAFETRRLAGAVVFGETLADVRRGADALRAYAAGGLAFDDTRVSVGPQADTPASGPVSVAWSATPGATVRLDATADGGRTWTRLADGLAAAGTQAFSAPGAGVYRVRATALTATGAGRAETGRLTALGAGAPVVTLAPPRGVLQGVATVAYTSASPTGTAPTVRLVLDGPLGPLTVAQGLPADGAFAWDTRLAPNGPATLRAEAVADGFVGTAEAVVLLSNPRAPLAPGALSAYAGRGDGTVEPRAVDPPALTGHTYRVDFAGGPERASVYTVTDETTGVPALGPTPVPALPAEGPAFDGVRLVVHASETAIRPDLSGWTTTGDPYALVTTVPNVTAWRLTGRALPYDYEVAFSDGLTTESLGGFRVGTSPLAPLAVAQLTNVTVTNVTAGRPAPFVFLDRDNSGSGFFGWTPGAQNSDNVIVYDCPALAGSCAAADLVPTVFLRANPTLVGGVYTLPGSAPGAGDTFTVRTQKAIQDGDTYRFQSLFVVGSETDPAPPAVALGAPFPNPASGGAAVRVTLAAPGAVRLRVFDALGREVARVLDGPLSAGTHTVPLPTHGLAPGLYAVRLDASEASAVQRLVVVR